MENILSAATDWLLSYHCKINIDGPFLKKWSMIVHACTYLKLLISPWKREFTSGITKWITACTALVMNSENFTGLNLSSGGT